MKKNTLLVALAAGVLAIVAALPAQAAQVKWNLENVTFSDGATVTGSFTIDAGAKTWSDFSFATTVGLSNC